MQEHKEYQLNTIPVKMLMKETEVKIMRNECVDCGFSGQICGKLRDYYLAPEVIEVNLLKTIYWFEWLI